MYATIKSNALYELRPPKKFVKNNLYTIIGAVDVVDSKESFQEDRYLLQISVIFDIVLH